jgi:hypothetical protein
MLYDFPGRMSELEVVQSLKDGRLKGLIKCQITIPESRWGELLEIGPIFAHRDVTLQDLARPLDERLRKHYPYLPAEEKANIFMTKYAVKYGAFVPGSLASGRKTLVSCFSTTKPQFFTHHYLLYLQQRFDAIVFDIGMWCIDKANKYR